MAYGLWALRAPASALNTFIANLGLKSFSSQPGLPFVSPQGLPFGFAIGDPEGISKRNLRTNR
jgi:hypothetical protein